MVRSVRNRTERAGPALRGCVSPLPVGDARKINAGFTLIELVIVVGLIGTLSAIVVPSFFDQMEQVRQQRVLVDLREIDADIAQFGLDNNALPATLAEVGHGSKVDAWGNPYQYLNILAGGAGVAGQRRKDHFLVPVNSDYDLYSLGPDGESDPPFTADVSRDDIVRASDGAFIGLVSEF